MNFRLILCFILTAMLCVALADDRREDRGCAEEETEEDAASTVEGVHRPNPSEAKQDEKRKWGEGGMRAWGKREETGKRDWNRNSMRAWGKREEGEREAKGDDDKKASWGKSSLRVWGKRDANLEEDKRKWGENKMRVWGKRDHEETGDEKKRSWDKSGPLRAWGKKSDPEAHFEEGSKKRDWGSKVRAWGKRDNSGGGEDRHEKLSPEEEDSNKMSSSEAEDNAGKGATKPLKTGRKKRSSWNSDPNAAFRNRMNYYPPEGPKRSWRTNVIRVWGKRAML